MHQKRVHNPPQIEPRVGFVPKKVASTEKYPGTAPYAPCPCNSGKKYKFCCKIVSR
ncbi:MAG: SEC-C metal-binding domain-containing protein [Planctomycetota bacterium]|nr:SEC-C metal-binding domain-containing protein [Planctomycetota bacterium]